MLVAHGAAAKDVAAKDGPGIKRDLGEIEGRAKLLSQGADGAKRFTAFTKWLGVGVSCSGTVDTVVSTKWITANLDEDADEERVLAVTSSFVGSAGAPSTRLDVIVFDSSAGGYIAAGHKTFSITTKSSPTKSSATTEVIAAPVHSSKMKDLVLRIDGQSATGDRAQELHVATFEHGKLEELASSADFVGSALVSHALTGGPPSTLELVHDKGKASLWFDEASFTYDALPGYEEALKKTTSSDDAQTISVKECSAPLPGNVALDCGLDGKAKVQVLVQNGKATGLTITATPANTPFVRCMRKHVAAASWSSATGATGCTRTFATK